LNNNTVFQTVNQHPGASCYNAGMSKRGGKREGAGRKSLEEEYGERIIVLSVRLPESLYRHVSSQDCSAAEYIRRLVERDIRRPPNK
jgi:hypothetical protein